MKLDLGSGPTPRDGHLGIDVRAYPAVPGQHDGVLSFPLDQGERWPFADESVEALYSSHLIEHLPATTVAGKDVLAHFFEQAWRVALMGATFFLRWPSLIDEQTGAWLPSAFFDPTHRRWIPREQLLYFSSVGRHDLDVEQYDFRCNWVIERVAQASLTTDRTVLEYQALLRKHPL